MIEKYETGAAYPRRVKLEIGRQGDIGFVLDGRSTPNSNKVFGYEIEGEMSYRMDGQPPKGRLSVSNPPDELVQQIRSGVGFVRLFAGYGYEEERLGLILAGAPVRNSIEHKFAKSGDSTLSMEVMSGGSRYRTAKVGRALEAGAPLRTELAGLIEAAGWAVGEIDIDEATHLQESTVFWGQGNRELDRLLREYQLEPIYEDGTVHVVRRGMPLPSRNTRDAQVFSAVDGTLYRDYARTEKGVSFSGVLTPELRCGSVVVAEILDRASGKIQRNRIVATDVTHRVSVFGDSFETRVSGAVRGAL